uniref:Tetratricopeptide repeat protein n=1 Tax=Oscillatoriales cyanobacterium SpSt-402 TaxID=2282168 RepID=A0A832H281_9CYAN
MEEFGNQQNELDPAQLITDYAEALQSLPSDSKLSSHQVLKILRSRDRLQAAIANGTLFDDEYLAELVDLDLTLKQHANQICETEHLEQLRQSLEPPESAWWWHLEPIAPSSHKKPLSDKFDWLWNVGTVTCLVIATSFITQTAKAFSTEGFDFLGTLTTIGQGAGLAFIAGGALTDKGKQVVSQVLSSVKVPASLHAEATFGASLILLGTAYSFNQNLHVVGNWYFDQAQHHEKQGEWSQAFKSYQRSLNFAPDDYKTQIAVGFLYERLGNFERAIEEYKKGTAFGIPEFLNAQARAMLMAGLQKNDWQGGIDSQIIRDAESLLERADKTTIDFSRRFNESRQDQRLAADIRINRAIAKLASIPFAENLNEKSRTTLNQVVDELQFLKVSNPKEQPETTTSLTTASTLGNARTECFSKKAVLIGRISESPNTYGIDHPIQDQYEFYACFPFRFDSKLAILPDAFLLRNYKFSGFALNDALKDNLEIEDSTSLTYFIYGFPVADFIGIKPPNYANRVILIQDPKTWKNLADQLTQKIQKNFVKAGSNTKQNVIWRFLLSQDGQIITYFAYDEASRNIGNTQPFIQAALQKKVVNQLIPGLKAGGKLEFVDFKVVLSQDGKILQILPWQMAYTTSSAIECEKKCKNLALNPQVRSTFQPYTPDIKDPAELGALSAVVTANSYTWGIDTNSGVYYREPGIFKLKISSDGQVISHQAMNQVAIQRFGKSFPFLGVKFPQFPKLKKAPYAELKLEFSGLGYRFIPWSKNQ